MIEDDARKKWCPFTVQQHYHGAGNAWIFVAINRIWDKVSGKVQVPRACHCIASDCMAWRWAETFNNAGQVHESRTDGYCGLAGKP